MEFDKGHKSSDICGVVEK